ncbi:MAG: NADH-quinone oxidoreductase subunit C [bacterium]|nr:NADH-quinone oxidoreductase subunit C [bacterium]
MDLFQLTKEQLLQKATELKSSGWLLMLLSGVDRQDKFQAVYHFHKHGAPDLLQLTVDLPKENPAIASLASLFPLADWMERETYDLFGIRFDGHPNLKRLFLPDNFEGYPLRKDFIAYKRLLPGG